MHLPPFGVSLVQRLFAAEFLGQVSLVLILITAAGLIYRSFRERFFRCWLYGWLAYLGYEVALAVSANSQHERAWQAAAHVAFLLAMAEFATAVLFYAGDARPLLWVGGIGAAGVVVVVFHDLFWPGALLLHSAMYTAGLAIGVIAAWRLFQFARGRPGFGPWLLIAGLLLLHPHDVPDAEHFLPLFDGIVELIVGMSMLVLVLDDSRARSRRLAVAAAINSIIAQSDDSEPMLKNALKEIMALMGGDAAWVRFLDEGGLVLAAQVGLSSEYIMERRFLSLQSFSARVLREGVTGVIRTADARADMRDRLRKDGYDHVLVVPVHGKAAALGTLAVGVKHYRWYTSDEKKFLMVAADQLGIAVENMRMFDQVLRSKMQWVSTFDSIDDAIIVHDSENRLLRVNRALVDKLKCQPMDIVGRLAAEVLPGGGEKWQGCPYCWRGRAGIDAADPCFGGYSLVSTSMYIDAQVGQRGTIHIIRDTTSAKVAEERYRELFEGVQEGVFVSTDDGRLLDCNEAFVRLLGYASRAELKKIDIARQLYVDAEQREKFRRAMSKDGFVRGFESELRRQDGSVLTVLENASAARDSEGNLRFHGFILDITERKRAEEQIRLRNRELFALNRILTVSTESFDLDEILAVALKQVVELFQADSGGAYLFDSEHNVLHRRAAFGYASKKTMIMPDIEVPPEAVSMVRHGKLEVLTQDHMKQLPAAAMEFLAEEGIRAWMWTVLWANEEIVGLIGIDCRNPREFTAADENLMTAIGRQLAVTVQKVRLYEATMRAYKDLQRAQEQLLQSEKMSAIGQLISGVAHELNNPLTAILGYAQLLESGQPPERVADFAGKLYKQAQRTQKIVQNLLTFARQRRPEQRPLDVRKVIDDTLALRDYDLKLNNIQVERDYEPHVPEALGDPHQLEQVFLNIVNNAVDAMLERQRGGRLRVRCYAEDSHVVMEFHDSGPGISDISKVFDPFYTTKSIGKGTGLGLSICYSILKQHGGEIAARNPAEGGACFELRLPTAAAGPHRAGDHRPSYPHVVLSGRILLVDDEEAILDFESEVLRTTGAEVVAVTCGEDAFERLQKEHFDAVITDAKMPGKWSGLDLYHWVVKQRPDLRSCFVLTVSNAGDPEIARFLQETHIPCMVKPFEMTDFLNLVRRTVERAKGIAHA